MVELQADAYYYKIQNCDDINQLEFSLPNKAIPEFAAIMEKIIQKLNEDLSSLYELRQENTSDEKEMVEEINKLIYKIEFCHNYLSPELKKDNHLIFALSSANQVLPLSDVESIDKEFYPVILALLENLQQELRTNNPKKQKVLTNNKTIKGVKEVKNFQTRVLYKSIKDNIVYVFLIMIKKEDWSKRDDTKVDARLRNIQSNYDYILSLDDESLEKELEKHQIYYDEIISFLNTTKVKKEPLEEESLKKAEKEKESRFDLNINFKNLPSEWQKYYILAKKLKRDNGSIKVRTTYIYHGFEIGRWFKRQKDAYDNHELTEYQIRLLEQLGIEWHSPKIEILTLEPEKKKTSTQRLGNIPIVKNKLKVRWYERYQLAKEFYKANNHLRIPTNYVVNGIKLGNWITNQRQRYKKGQMSSEQITLLESIGMLWKVYKPRKNKNLDLISSIYQKLYNMTDDEVEEFILRLENDNEGINKISKK